MTGGTWYLGVDLGTTYVAAAVRRDERNEIVTLGTRAAVEPTVVVADGDRLLVGEAAERRAGTAPERTVRQFKRRLGDSTPLLLGGVPYSPQALLAAVLADVVERTSVEQGGPPERIAITHPANWGPYKRELVRQVADLADLEPSRVRTLTEPAAAAVHYASQAGLEPGSVVAVYDLGGGTFDAAVLRVEASGAELLGEPTGIEHLGGIDVDAAVLGHVRAELGPRFDVLEADEHAGLLGRLREECVRAKEALSSDSDTVIGVPLPDGYVEVRLTRRELEGMIRPALAPTADALRRAITSAGLTPDDLAGVLLVGGSSRIPLVSELVSGALGRPVLLDAHPKHAVALGAAAYAAGDRVDDGAVAVVAPDEPADATAILAAATAARPPRRGRRLAVTVLAVAALVGGGVAAAQLGSGDDPDEDVSTGDDGDETTTEPDGETTSTDTTATSTSTSSSTTTTADPGGGGGTETTDPGGGGPGPDRGTTVPPQQTTTTTQPVAPGAPASALLFSPAVASPAPDNPVIEVQLQWSAPTSQGTGVDGYRLIGRMIVSGTNHVETITRDFGASERTASITYTSRGLANNGYIEWTLVARNEAGSSAPRLVSARVPNVVGTSTDDVYHRLWALGVIVDTNPNATCDVDEVCSQETSPNSTVPNRSRLVIHT